MVYVDQLFDTTRMRSTNWKFNQSCHMFADTLYELHLFARGIGMKPEWYQDQPRLPHYDLTASRRKAAVLAGARSVTTAFLINFMRVRKRWGNHVVTVHVGDEVYWDVDRASGLVLCSVCGQQYYDHPMFTGVKSYADEPFLHLICGNILVKL